jgi:hypothetical protein
MDNVNSEINDLITHTNALHCSEPSAPFLDDTPVNSTLPPSLILVGKIISMKPVSKSAIKKNILQAWQFVKSLTTEDKDDNKMVFTFENQEDLSRVLDNSPWNINGSPLFLKRWENDETFDDIGFSKAAIWVQVHGLPLEKMTVTNATRIAESLGGLVEIDNLDNLKPCRKSFLRIRVLIPLEEPLATGFLLQRPPKPPTQIYYQYERLSEFCYSCGRLGHLSFECPVSPCPAEAGTYGPKLKAKSPFANRVELLMPSRRSLFSPAPSGSSSQALASYPGESGRTPIKLSPTRSVAQPHSLLTHPIANKSLTPSLLPESETLPPLISALNEKPSTVNVQLKPTSSSLLSTNAANSLQQKLSNSLGSTPNFSTDPTPPYLSSSITTNPSNTTCTPITSLASYSIPAPISTISPTATVSPPSEKHVPLTYLKPPKYPIVTTSKKRFHPYQKSSSPSSSSTNSEPQPAKKPKPCENSSDGDCDGSEVCDKETDVSSSLGLDLDGVAGFFQPPPTQ